MHACLACKAVRVLCYAALRCAASTTKKQQAKSRHANEKIESGRQKVFPPNLSDILTLDELLSKAQLPCLATTS